MHNQVRGEKKGCQIIAGKNNNVETSLLVAKSPRRKGCSRQPAFAWLLLFLHESGLLAREGITLS